MVHSGSEREGDVHRHVREQTEKHLDSYARDGLRTLCIAKKVLEEEEYEVWMKRQLQAESSIENREELLQDSAQRLETQLTLLGVFWERWGGKGWGWGGCHLLVALTHPPSLYLQAPQGS